MQVTVHYNKLMIAPRKIRVILDWVRGQKVPAALAQLSASPRVTAEPVRKLLLASVSAAKDKRASVRAEDLTVKEIYCNEGPRLYRTMVRGRGRASRYAKRGSHLTLTVIAPDTTTPAKAAKKPASKTASTPTEAKA